MMPTTQETIQDIYKSADEAYKTKDLAKGQEAALKLIAILKEPVKDVKDAGAKDAQQHKQATFAILKLWINYARNNSQIAAWFSSQDITLAKLQKLLADMQGESAAYASIGRMLYQKGELSWARQNILNALALPNKDSTLSLTLANINRDLTEYGSAYYYYNQYLAQHKGDVDAMLGIADILQATQDTDYFLFSEQTKLEIVQSVQSILRGTAITPQQREQRKRAETLKQKIEAAATKPKEVKEEEEKSATTEPKNLKTEEEKSATTLPPNDKALTQLRTEMVKLADNPDQETQLRLAECYLHTEVFQPAQQLNPYSAAFYAQVGINLPRIVQWLQKMPENTTARNLLAHIAYFTESADSAIEQYKQAIKTGVATPAYNLLIANCYIQKKEYGAALTYFREYLSTKDESVDSLSVYWLMVKIYFGTKLSINSSVLTTEAEDAKIYEWIESNLKAGLKAEGFNLANYRVACHFDFLLIHHNLPPLESSTWKRGYTFEEYQQADKVLQAALFTFVVKVKAEPKPAGAQSEVGVIFDDAEKAYRAGEIDKGNQAAGKLIAFAHADEKSPQQDWAHCLLSRLHFSNEVDGAFKEGAKIKQFFASHNIDKKKCIKWLEAMPDYAAALVTLGDIQYHDNPEKQTDGKQYDKAIALYKEAFKLDVPKIFHSKLALAYIKKQELLASFLHLRVCISNPDADNDVYIYLATMVVNTQGWIAALFFTAQDKKILLQKLKALATSKDDKVSQQLRAQAFQIIGIFYDTGWVVDKQDDSLTNYCYTQALALGCKENAGMMQEFIDRYSKQQQGLSPTPISKAAAGFVNQIGGKEAAAAIEVGKKEDQPPPDPDQNISQNVARMK